MASHEMTPEERLLCRLARTDRASEAGEAQPPDGAVAVVDWEAFWNLALRHEVQPLVWSRIRSDPRLRSAVPAPLAQRAERSFHATALRNRSRSAELGRILGTLADAGIDVMPVKGVVLDELVYGSSAPRTFDDLDILTPRTQLAAAREILRVLGYHGRRIPRFEEVDHRFHDLQLFRSVDGAEQCLEVHWDLWPSARFDSIVDDLWRRSRRARVAGADVRTLSDEDTILHLAIHRTSSALRLRFVCDVAEIVRQRQAELDWAALESRARAIGAVVALHMMLRLARDLLDAPVPEDLLVRTRPGRTRRWLLERTCGTRALFRRVRHDDHRQQPHLAYRILEMDRPSRVARALVAGAFRKRAKRDYNRRARLA